MGGFDNPCSGNSLRNPHPFTNTTVSQQLPICPPPPQPLNTVPRPTSPAQQWHRVWSWCPQPSLGPQPSWNAGSRQGDVDMGSNCTSCSALVIMLIVCACASSDWNPPKQDIQHRGVGTTSSRGRWTAIDNLSSKCPALRVQRYCWYCHLASDSANLPIPRVQWHKLSDTSSHICLSPWRCLFVYLIIEARCTAVCTNGPRVVSWAFRRFGGWCGPSAPALFFAFSHFPTENLATVITAFFKSTSWCRSRALQHFGEPFIWRASVFSEQGKDFLTCTFLYCAPSLALPRWIAGANPRSLSGQPLQPAQAVGPDSTLNVSRSRPHKSSAFSLPTLLLVPCLLSPSFAVADSVQCRRTCLRDWNICSLGAVLSTMVVVDDEGSRPCGIISTGYEIERILCTITWSIYTYIPVWSSICCSWRSPA